MDALTDHRQHGSLFASTDLSEAHGRLAEDLARLSCHPSTPVPPLANEELRKIDEVGDRLGFPSREAPVRRKKRQRSGEAFDQINIRAAISDINAYVEFCEANRYTFGEAFRLLVRHLPADPA